MPAIQTTPGNQARLRTGAALMTLAGLAFVAYAAVFLVLNFTGAFLELGIGPDQVDKGMAEVEAFSPQLHHYISHLHIALGGFIYFYSSRTGPDVAATDMRAPITQKAPAETTGSGSGGDTPMPPAKPAR